MDTARTAVNAGKGGRNSQGGCIQLSTTSDERTFWNNLVDLGGPITLTKDDQEGGAGSAEAAEGNSN